LGGFAGKIPCGKEDDIVGNYEFFESGHDCASQGQWDTQCNEKPESWSRKNHALLAGTMLLVNDRYLVLTPEKVVISYQHAGYGARIGAHLIDLLLVVVGYTAVAMIISFTAMVVGQGLANFFLALFITFGIFAYFIVLEVLWQGQTLGKKMLKIRVLQSDGTPLNWRSSFMRNILRIADILPGFSGLGFMTLFLNENSQRLGDLIAGTVVVSANEIPQGFTPAPYKVGIHPLEYSVGELGGMTLPEYHAIKRLCDRFPYLPIDEQYRSLQAIWEPFRERERIQPLPNVHAIYQMEAVVMKFGRMKNLV
jgi:uncharacterized RDD family membrane protein YckC